MSGAAAHEYDLCVIGCGPAGYAGAMRALDLGKRVCLVEGGEPGGTGVMWGALASKTMWELAKDYDVASKVDRGYRAVGLQVDYQAVRDTVMAAVKEKQYQMLSQLETFSPRRWDGPGGITLERGWARFAAPDRVAVSRTDGSRVEISARYFILATGSRPRGFPGVAVDQQRILDSDGVLNLTAFPRRLVIIGAGIIGCEYATIFSNFGQTRVYLVDHADQVMPYEDQDISSFVSSKLADNGVTIYQNAALRSITPRQGHLEVILDFAAGHSEVVEADAALIAIGREPNLQGAGLPKAGIDAGAGGFLERDEHGRVAENVYAVGDLGRHPALVNIAETEARHAVEHMFGLERDPPNFSNMSTVMFFKPAVAAVGLNEKGCQNRGFAYRVARYSNALLPRAIAMRALDGFVKIIVDDAAPQPILGMRAAGPQASNTIMAIAMLMDQGSGIADVLKVMYPHPTMSEGIQECLRLLAGKSIYKSQAFPKYIQIRRWSPQAGYED